MARVQVSPKPSQRGAPSWPVLAMGLMSGTSQDGVDIALIETDGDIVSRFGATAHRSYSTPERALIRSATAAAVNITERAARPEIVASAEAAVNEVHANAAAGCGHMTSRWSGFPVKPCCIGHSAD